MIGGHEGDWIPMWQIRARPIHTKMFDYFISLSALEQYRVCLMQLQRMLTIIVISQCRQQVREGQKDKLRVSAIVLTMAWIYCSHYGCFFRLQCWYTFTNCRSVLQKQCSSTHFITSLHRSSVVRSHRHFHGMMMELVCSELGWKILQNREESNEVGQQWKLVFGFQGFLRYLERNYFWGIVEDYQRVGIVMYEQFVGDYFCGQRNWLHAEMHIIILYTCFFYCQDKYSFISISLFFSLYLGFFSSVLDRKKGRDVEILKKKVNKNRNKKLLSSDVQTNELGDISQINLFGKQYQYDHYFQLLKIKFLFLCQFLVSALFHTYYLVHMSQNQLPSSSIRSEACSVPSDANHPSETPVPPTLQTPSSSTSLFDLHHVSAPPNSQQSILFAANQQESNSSHSSAVSSHMTEKTPPNTHHLKDSLLIDTPFVPFRHQSISRTNWQSEETIVEEKEQGEKMGSSSSKHASENNRSIEEKKNKKEDGSNINPLFRGEDVELQLELELKVEKGKSGKVSSDSYSNCWQDSVSIEPTNDKILTHQFTVEVKQQPSKAQLFRQKQLTVSNKHCTSYKPKKTLTLSNTSEVYLPPLSQKSHNSAQTNPPNEKNHETTNTEKPSICDVCLQTSPIPLSYTHPAPIQIPPTHHPIADMSQQTQHKFSRGCNINLIIGPTRQPTSIQGIQTLEPKTNAVIVQTEVRHTTEQLLQTQKPFTIDTKQQTRRTSARHRITPQKQMNMAVKADYGVFLEKITRNYAKLMEDLLQNHELQKKRSEKKMKNASTQWNERDRNTKRDKIIKIDDEQSQTCSMVFYQPPKSSTKKNIKMEVVKVEQDDCTGGVSAPRPSRKKRKSRKKY